MKTATGQSNVRECGAQIQAHLTRKGLSQALRIDWLNDEYTGLPSTFPCWCSNGEGGIDSLNITQVGKGVGCKERDEHGLDVDT
jgi:hypothetical protein